MVLTSIQRGTDNEESNQFEELEHFSKTPFKEEYIIFESDKMKKSLCNLKVAVSCDFSMLRNENKNYYILKDIVFISDIKGFRVTIFNTIGWIIKEDKYKNRKEFEGISYAKISKLSNFYMR